MYVALWLNPYQLRSDKQQGTTYAVINYSRLHSPLLLLSSLSSKVLWLTWMEFGAQCTSTKRLYVDPLTVVLTPNYLCCHSKMECVCVRVRLACAVGISDVISLCSPAENVHSTSGCPRNIQFLTVIVLRGDTSRARCCVMCV